MGVHSELAPDRAWVTLDRSDARGATVSSPSPFPRIKHLPSLTKIKHDSSVTLSLCHKLTFWMFPSAPHICWVCRVWVSQSSSAPNTAGPPPSGSKRGEVRDWWWREKGVVCVFCVWETWGTNKVMGKLGESSQDMEANKYSGGKTNNGLKGQYATILL